MVFDLEISVYSLLPFGAGIRNLQLNDNNNYSQTTDFEIIIKQSTELVFAKIDMYQ